MNISDLLSAPKLLTIRKAGALCAALMIFAGCGYSAAPLPARTAVVLWHSLSGGRERALLALIDQWNSSASGVLVIPEKISAENFHQRVLVGAARSALPQLLLASPSQTAVYARSNIIAPLDDLISDQDRDDPVGWSREQVADLFPFMLAAGKTPQGLTVGVPQGGVARLMLYNQDLLRSLNMKLQQAPDDWETFTSTCARVSDPSRGLACLGLDSSAPSVEEWVRAHGGETVDRAGTVQINEQPGRNAFERLRMLLANGQAYGGADANTLKDDFASARTLYAFDWSSSFISYKSAIKLRDNFDVGIATLPFRAVPAVADTARAAVPFGAPLWVLPRSNSIAQRQAWRFVRWMTSTKASLQWALETNELPARRSAVDLAATSKTELAQTMVPVWRLVAPSAVPAPLLAGLPCANDAFVTSLRNIEDGTRTVEEALLNAQTLAAGELPNDCATP